MSERTCSIDGCEKPYLARGFCRKHYSRMRTHGDPLKVERIRGDDEARLWSKINRRGEDECWPWAGQLRPTGYGDILMGGKRRGPHRAAYELAVGPVPDGMVLDHTCHRPEECAGGSACPHRRCCNPRHLAAVAHAVNASAARAVSHYRRKTHCKRGHEFTPENTYTLKSGGRQCRACARDRARERARRNKEGVSRE